MKFTVITILDTDLPPQTLIDEIRSTFEYDGSADIDSIVVLIDDETEVGVYNKEQA